MRETKRARAHRKAQERSERRYTQLVYTQGTKRDPGASRSKSGPVRVRYI